MQKLLNGSKTNKTLATASEAMSGLARVATGRGKFSAQGNPWCSPHPSTFASDIAAAHKSSLTTAD